MQTIFSQRAEAEVEAEVIRAVVMDVASPEVGMNYQLLLMGSSSNLIIRVAENHLHMGPL